MGIFPWVIGLLLVLSCTAWIEFKQLVETTFIITTDLASLRAEFNSKYSLVNERAKFLFDSLKKKDTTNKEGDPLISTQTSIKTPLNKKKVHEEKQTSEEFIPDEKALPKNIRNQLEHPVARNGLQSLRLSRRVHLNELFSGNEGTQRKEIEKKIFLRLMQTNYQSLFQMSDGLRPAKNSSVIPEQILESLVQEISRLKEHIAVKDPERLANFVFEDKNLSYIFFRMLKGGTLSSSILKVRAPSLLSLLSTQQRKTIASIYLAPKAVLRALTDDEKQVDTIIQERNEIYKKLTEKSKDGLIAQDKTVLQEEFTSRVQGLISRDIDVAYIDFGISKTCPPR